MAEAVLAFGIAANIVQFVEFSSKVFSTGYRLGDSGYGGVKTNQSVETIATDLRQVTRALEDSLQQQDCKQLLTQNELDLLNLAGKCKDVTSELFIALGRLKIQGKPGKWNTFRAALKTVLKEEEIKTLEKQIAGFRQQLIIRILMSFRYVYRLRRLSRTKILHVVRDQMNRSNTTQSSVLDDVKRIDKNTQGLGEKFLDLVDTSGGWKADLIDAIHQDGASAWDRGLISPNSSTKRERYLQAKLLDRLRFSEMSDRQNRITEAYEKTFVWLYRGPKAGTTSWHSFTEWLDSGSSIYWITGKAGSGKSTLMKYIYSNRCTFKHLETWSSGVPVVTAAFFLWNSGTDMQMSQMGLLRSLLHQILSKCPGLIPVVLPERWEAYTLFSNDPHPWTQVELRQAFRLLAKEEPRDTKFCFFIDGLDEFEGDHTNLINLLQDLISSPQIKICVSSRPWIIFEDAFKHRASLMLQDLTYPDIKRYVSSNFLENPGFAELENREPEYASQLIEDIVQKAAGVFLWVHLVVTSLLSGLMNGDRVSDLQRRLEFLPTDLEDLYQKMLNSLDPFYLEHASQLFQLVRAALQPPTLLCLSFADEEETFVFKSKVKPLTDKERVSRADIMRRRLNSRCKGLLEIAPNTIVCEGSFDATDGDTNPLAKDDNRVIETVDGCIADSTVQYLHRTVKDFLESPKIWKPLLDVGRVTMTHMPPSFVHPFHNSRFYIPGR
jgi:hypothetical protein